MIVGLKLLCLVIAVIFAFIAAFSGYREAFRPYSGGALAISIFFYELKDLVN